MPNSGQAEILQVVVVNICLDAATNDIVMDAIDSLPWQVETANLTSYSSSIRRPALGPQVKAAHLAVAFIDFNQNRNEALYCAQFLNETYGQKLFLIAVGDDDHADIILEAMRAGCSEYLTLPLERNSLTRTLQRLADRGASSHQKNSELGSLLALLGPKGGVGTTTLATHLAVYLAQTKKRVLLVDCQPELGHACIYLGLDGRSFHFADVVRNVGRLDSDLLQGYVAKHSSGLSVLSSPEALAGPRSLDPRAVLATLNFLRSEFDYVILDCERGGSDVTTVALSTATQVFLVMTPDLGSIRDTSRYVDRLLSTDDAGERVQVVLNRAAPSAGLDAAQIEEALKLHISVRIPNNYPAFLKASNLGEPIPASSSLDVAREMRRWAESVDGVSLKNGKSSQRRGLMRLLSRASEPPAMTKARGATA